MQLLRVYMCLTYADAGHMDMVNLCSVLPFFMKIRKLAKSDLPFLSMMFRIKRLGGKQESKMNYCCKNKSYITNWRQYGPYDEG